MLGLPLRDDRHDYKTNGGCSFLRQSGERFIRHGTSPPAPSRVRRRTLTIQSWIDILCSKSAHNVKLGARSSPGLNGQA